MTLLSHDVADSGTRDDNRDNHRNYSFTPRSIAAQPWVTSL